MATPERTSSETIYQACLDLRNTGRSISRPVLAKVTGLKMGIVDDHVTRLADNGKLRRLHGGFVEVVEQFPANRVISKTVLPNGLVRMEIDDLLVELTPSEAGIWGGMLLPEATMFAQLRGDRDNSDEVARMRRQLDDNRRRIEELIKQVARLGQQPQLAFD